MIESFGGWCAFAVFTLIGLGYRLMVFNDKSTKGNVMSFSSMMMSMLAQVLKLPWVFLVADAIYALHTFFTGGRGQYVKGTAKEEKLKDALQNRPIIARVGIIIVVYAIGVGIQFIVYGTIYLAGG